MKKDRRVPIIIPRLDFPLQNHSSILFMGFWQVEKTRIIISNQLT
jgi:hypothetical protein